MTLCGKLRTRQKSTFLVQGKTFEITSFPVNRGLQSTDLLPQGNVFTPVCHSVHRGVSVSGPGGLLHPPGQTPPRAENPWADTPCAVHAGIRLTSDRYASYWNAFLLLLILAKYVALVILFTQITRILSDPQVCCSSFLVTLSHSH